tara:strand:+ start:158 stop:367 length:210 start_codon:yes stop_codon:yes gene_type:complete
MSKTKPEVASKADMVAAYKQVAVQIDAFKEAFGRTPDWSDECINELATKVYVSTQKQKATGSFGYNKAA